MAVSDNTLNELQRKEWTLSSQTPYCIPSPRAPEVKPTKKSKGWKAGAGSLRSFLWPQPKKNVIMTRTESVETTEFFALSAQSTTDKQIDESDGEERVERIFHHGPSLRADAARVRQLRWMTQNVEMLEWPIDVPFIALHAADNVSANIARTSEPAVLAAACLLLGVSAQCSHREISKIKDLVNNSESIHSTRDIVLQQMKIVSEMRGGSLLHKTPIDFLVYYFARLYYLNQQISEIVGRDDFFGYLVNYQPSPTTVMEESNSSFRLYVSTWTMNPESGPELLPGQSLGIGWFLPSVFDLCIRVAFCSYVTKTYMRMPSSIVIAVVILRSLSLVGCPISNPNILARLAHKLFAFDDTVQLIHPMQTMGFLLEYCLRNLPDSKGWGTSWSLGETSKNILRDIYKDSDFFYW